MPLPAPMLSMPIHHMACTPMLAHAPARTTSTPSLVLFPAQSQLAEQRLNIKPDAPDFVELSRLQRCQVGSVGA